MCLLRAIEIIQKEHDVCEREGESGMERKRWAEISHRKWHKINSHGIRKWHAALIDEAAENVLQIYAKRQTYTKKRLKNPFWIIRNIWSVESKLKELPLNTNGPRVLDVCTDKRENVHQQHKWMNGFFLFRAFGEGEKKVRGRYKQFEWVYNTLNKRISRITHTHIGMESVRDTKHATHIHTPILQLNYRKVWANIYFESHNNLNAPFYAIIQCYWYRTSGTAGYIFVCVCVCWKRFLLLILINTIWQLSNALIPYAWIGVWYMQRIEMKWNARKKCISQQIKP